MNGVEDASAMKRSLALVRAAEIVCVVLSMKVPVALNVPVPEPWTPKITSENVNPGTEMLRFEKVLVPVPIWLKPWADTSVDSEVKRTVGVPVCEPTCPVTLVPVCPLRKTFCSPTAPGQLFPWHGVSVKVAALGQA